MREPLRWGDIVVPYVAAWSSELPERVAIDPHAGEMDAIFCGGKRGEGKPVFGKMDFARQRECVSRKLCQVCREPMERMFVMGRIPQWIQEGFVRRPLLGEPCVCAACANYALDNCPGLQRQMLHPSFLAAEIFKYDRVPCLLQPMEISEYPGLDRVLKAFGRSAVGYVKLRLLKYQNMTLSAFRSTLEAAHA